MKRWRTKGFAVRRLAAAALAVFVVAGWRPDGRAEPAGSAAASFSRADLARFGDLVRNEIASRKIPGAVLLIQQHGKPVYLQSFGVRSVATRLPMTPDTIFRIYSMSKAVTS